MTELTQPTEDVTTEVRFGANDDEYLPLTRCRCGASWEAWGGPTLCIYPDDPTPCPECGRRYYFANGIRVYEVLSR